MKWNKDKHALSLEKEKKKKKKKNETTIGDKPLIICRCA